MLCRACKKQKQVTEWSALGGAITVTSRSSTWRTRINIHVQDAASRVLKKNRFLLAS